MRDPLSKVATRLDRLVAQVPEDLTREQIRKMSDAELKARVLHYARIVGVDTVGELLAVVADDPELAGPASARSLGSHKPTKEVVGRDGAVEGPCPHRGSGARPDASDGRRRASR